MSNRLNPRQKKWVDKFLSAHPYYELKQVWSGLDSDRYLRLEGFEMLPLPLSPEFTEAKPGYRLHTLLVQLRKYGDLRRTSRHDCETVYPHCNLDSEPTLNRQLGQLLLPIPAAVLAVKEPENPAVYNWKPKLKAKPKQGTQLSLPVTGMEAELYRLRQEKRPYLPPVSSQELLAETVETWSLRDSRSVEVPQVLLDLLRSHNANENESQNAIDLFEVTGLRGAMMYVEGLPYLRKRGQTTVSTVGASTEVAAAYTKTVSDVPVKAIS